MPTDNRGSGLDHLDAQVSGVVADPQATGSAPKGANDAAPVTVEQVRKAWSRYCTALMPQVRRYGCARMRIDPPLPSVPFALDEAVPESFTFHEVEVRLYVWSDPKEQTRKAVTSAVMPGSGERIPLNVEHLPWR